MAAAWPREFRLSRVLRAVAIIFLLILNLLLSGTLVLVTALVKFLTFGELRRRVILAATWLAQRWVDGNWLIFRTFLDTEWRFIGLDDLRRDGRYLVISNHLSWIDIFACFFAFRDAAFLRFFLKQILIWFPIAGQACWALSFPFMRRYTPDYLAQHPEKRGRDLETTRKACRLYRHIPVAILNFVEGTRISREKLEDQQSPYQHLLRPRVGGISFVLASLGEALDAMYDVTLIYPDPDVTMWDFITNRVAWVRIEGRRVEVPPEFQRSEVTEPGEAREAFKAWVDTIWREKDALIGKIIGTQVP